MELEPPGPHRHRLQSTVILEDTWKGCSIFVQGPVECQPAYLILVWSVKAASSSARRTPVPTVVLVTHISSLSMLEARLPRDANPNPSPLAESCYTTCCQHPCLTSPHSRAHRYSPAYCKFLSSQSSLSTSVLFHPDHDHDIWQKAPKSLIADVYILLLLLHFTLSSLGILT